MLAWRIVDRQDQVRVSECDAHVRMMPQLARAVVVTACDCPDSRACHWRIAGIHDLAKDRMDDRGHFLLEVSDVMAFDDDLDRVLVVRVTRFGDEGNGEGIVDELFVELGGTT